MALVSVSVSEGKVQITTVRRGALSRDMTQGKIDLRNESGRPMKVKVVGEVSEK